MSPIYLPPAVVSEAVRREEAAMIATEGTYHVAGRYIANETDAAKARLVEAQRRVRDRERLSRLSLPCPWCNREIRAGDEPVEIGGRNLHTECADEFDDWANTEADDMATERA